MIYSDLHCDTATEMYNKRLDFNGDFHINSHSLKPFEKCYQCFAVFTDDTSTNGGMSYFRSVLDYFMPLVRREKNIVPIITVEGGGVIEGDLDNIYELKRLGVRIFGLSWNGENELAAGARTNNMQPLTSLGIKALKILEETCILPDVSHLSERGFYDVFENYGGRVLATHSNCRRICSNLRNLTDEQIKLIIERKGLIGLNLYPPFLGDNACVDTLVKHAEHILSLGGEDCLALGCDFDGVPALPTGIKNVSYITVINKVFSAYFGIETTKKIIAYNVIRVLNL